MLKAEKVASGVEVHGRMLCHVLTSCLSSHCRTSDQCWESSCTLTYRHTHFKGSAVSPSQHIHSQELQAECPDF